MTQKELPEDYPHEKAVYLGGELVEMLGANVTTFETHDGEKVKTHEVFWSWFDQDERHRGVRTNYLGDFKADGGLTTLHETLLSLPERRVEGRDRLQ